MVNGRLRGGLKVGSCVALVLLISSRALSAPLPPTPPPTTVLGTLPQPAWKELKNHQITALLPLRSTWDQLGYPERKKWLGFAERFHQLPPAEQSRAHQRMREWSALTPEQRNKVRNTYLEFQQLPQERKSTVKQKWEAYSQLPPDEQKALRESGKSSTLIKPTPAVTPSVEERTETPASDEPKAEQ